MTEANRSSIPTKPKSAKRPVRVVLDTDAFNEVDDQFAIVQAILSPSQMTVEAIYAAPFYSERGTYPTSERSSSPEDGMIKSYDEILKIVDLLGNFEPGRVFRGVTDYARDEPRPKSAAAVDDLITRARTASSAEPIYVVAIGAISNIAVALRLAPDIIDRVVVVWLGGNAMYWPDIALDNLGQDPGAARTIFDCGVRVVHVPCFPVTSHLLASVPEIERYVEPHGAIGKFLSERFKNFEGCTPADHAGWTKALWDMGAVAYMINDQWIKSSMEPSPGISPEGGWIVGDNDRHQITNIEWIDRNAMMRDFYKKLSAFAQGDA